MRSGGDRDDAEPRSWEARAALAERAVLQRYTGGLPAVSWARSAWPPVPLPRRAGAPARWHYWWSAHLVDALIDACDREPSVKRRRRVQAFARGIRVRNGGWGRQFYDDIAWLGLAFERGGGILRRRSVVEAIASRLEGAVDASVGAIPWRVGSDFFNAPSNGPAAILFARTGRSRAATLLADWMHEQLRDDRSGLILDGLVVRGSERQPARELYPYCQGVALGAYCELARQGAGDRFARRAVALIDAVATWTQPTLVLPGGGGGDGGLFGAIACRYLGDATVVLQRLGQLDGDAELVRAAGVARRILVSCAEAVWAGRHDLEDGLPLFAADWRGRADPSPSAPERDLSVQLAGWLVLEAVAAVTRSSPAAPVGRTR